MTGKQYEAALGALGDVLWSEQVRCLRDNDLGLLKLGTVRNAYNALDEALYERRGLLDDLAGADACSAMAYDDVLALQARVEELESGA